MLTRKEVKEKGLKDGKDYIYLGNVRYREGDSFIFNDKELSVRRIIDSYHFLATHGECWHTGMFDDLHCLHGQNMIPLEYNERMFEKAEERLRYNQIFRSEVYTLQNGNLQRKGIFQVGYDPEEHDYRAEIIGAIPRNALSLYAAIGLSCPQYAEELRCIVQEWGVSGENLRGVLLDDGNERILYDGFEHTPVFCGKSLADGSNITVLKRYCSPAQRFSFVKDFTVWKNNECTGATIDEMPDFLDTVEYFESLTGLPIQNGTGNMQKLLQRGRVQYAKEVEL
mgnify:CR=1 FL=1